MKVVTLKTDLCHFLFGDLDALWVFALVYLSADTQSCCCLGRSYEIYDSSQIGQRPATPVGAYIGEQPMFDFVPFARSGREMADCDSKPGIVGKILKFLFPKTHSRTVTASAVGCDEERLGFWINPSSHKLPPAFDSPHGKAGRFVVNPDQIHPRKDRIRLSR